MDWMRFFYDLYFHIRYHFCVSTLNKRIWCNKLGSKMDFRIEIDPQPL